MKPHEKYPFLVWWHSDSHQHYVDALIKRADKEGAPRTSTYRSMDGTWRTIHDVSNLQTIDRLKKKFGNDVFDVWKDEE